MKNIIKMPSYMSKFKCIAAACEETCCAGWYIAIDERTYKKYKKVKHPEMKKRLDKEIVVKKGQVIGQNVAKIKLKNNRCAFLAKDNLCDLYTHLGESYLSETCKMYPRNTNEIGEKVELTIALSCPEAARVVLLNREPTTFIEEEGEALPIVGTHLKINPSNPKQFEDFLFEMRQILIEVIEDSNLSFKEIWQCLEQIMLKLHQFKQRQEIKKLAAYLKQMRNKGYVKLKDNKLTKESETLLSYEGAKHLISILTNMRETKKWPSTRYEVCYEKMINKLKSPLDRECYKQSEVCFEELFTKDYPYILKNYFVNYIYERLVPIDQVSPLESFKDMTLYLALLKLHLMGQLSEEGKMDQDEIITCIQSFSRVFDHNELYRQQIKKYLKKNKQG